MPAGYEDTTFTSRTARGAGAAVLVIALLGVVSLFVNRGLTPGVIGAVAWLVLAAVVYTLFWRPRLDVRDSGITVVNPLRTHRLEWPSVTDVESRWLLTLVTDSGPVAVWAVPRPSSATSMVGFRRDMYGLPDYEAEQRHERQDASGAPITAALTVIQARLRSR